MDRPALDHVILLLPYQDVVDPPEWLTKHFTISPGGRHGDGRTENRLVLFRDGTYLEIIAFIDDDPERRKGHWWDRAFGVVDFALTTREANPDVTAMNQRLASTNTGISYQPPQDGGRTRPDGVELKWRVTFPQGIQRGAVPFWCNDVTPRERRVPLDLQIDGAAATTHPCGATGMAGVIIEADGAAVARMRKAVAAIVETDSKEGFSVAVPLGVGARSYIHIREAAARSAADDIALSLVLRAPHAGDNIVRQVEGGKVSIRFEKSD